MKLVTCSYRYSAQQVTKCLLVLPLAESAPAPLTVRQPWTAVATFFWTRTGAEPCKLLIKGVSGVLRLKTASVECSRQVFANVVLCLLHIVSLSHISSKASKPQGATLALQVQGKSASDHYLVFPDHYCSCQAFFYEVVGRSEASFVSTPKHKLNAQTCMLSILYHVALPSAVQAPNRSSDCRHLQAVPSDSSPRSLTYSDSD